MTEATRRAVMLGAGGAGMAAVLTACAGGGDSASQETPAASPASSAPQTAASPPAEQGGSGAKVLAKTADIPEGGGKVFKAEKVVVTQPKPGEFKAFTSVCTHRGCDVSDVSGGTINCPCHGSRFNVADGSVARGPAARPLAEKAITVEEGSIVLG
ncbi:iron-sulfur protein [Streptosporangium violaceochromogenes]|nr:iron-sulfur protein [Streptosporangium violaceochromogenes]